ncbi:RNA polymerase sigma-70 factor [Aridibaculum aurantiacum]|uniref:RNA polymerase sigma-70 factor n=1 Tax=Aridibaculum aurantiacum TaxID=2810307 RepID=UPI001A95C79B|nr:RNA polymerase sigma-70 factor [Aridibaculum aurantiacum]
MDDCYHAIKHLISIGNEQAFSQLYNSFYARLIAFSKSITRSQEQAEEVVEDVFIKLWRKRQQLPGVQNLQVYLYVATKNTSLNAVADKAKTLSIQPFDDLDIDLDHQGMNPYDLMITQEMQMRMMQAIDNLPPRCKMIFKLVREDGLKYKDVAEVLNISVNTIDAQMAIAVKRISEALQVAKPKTTPSKKLQ